MLLLATSRVVDLKKKKFVFFFIKNRFLLKKKQSLGFKTIFLGTFV
jgi:hypothetical protein